MNVFLFIDSYTTAHMYTQRNTHSSSSTCHIPLSPDNIAAVKVAASVIGRTNHSRGDGMVPSCRSESRGGPRQRTSCQSAASEKEKKKKRREKSLLFCGFPPCINVIFTVPLLRYMAIRLVFICTNGHPGLLQHAYDANLPSGFHSYLVLLPHYLLCSLRAESPLTSISRGSSWVAFQSGGANINVIH